ncbi:hypothetical protein FVEG_04462 [Fusarium verticillioides 7600]|uniref:Uncharacterized protein n=1 Tax=Gibberella moniliformis (strain M3125 / FGSC 7600) TaxID=334819 RepID=W7M562_GIBM7|nr:hypothetical protein FVEG_04462 [Fusarium verticillioides 7600]EWG42715.1 hypothetical protein FVEG_04462 [Fusarium verticillioides 7600]
MVCFLKVCCPCFFRRHRAGSSRGGSFESDRPSSERRLGNRQPEAQEGGEPPREVELLNQDAAEQPDAPRIGPQPDNEITSFPRLDGSSDGDNPSNDVSQQDPPQRGTGIAPQANDTQTNIGNTSNNVSQQGAPQHGTPKPRSRRESRSTTAGPYAPLILRDLLESTSSSSASASQANDTQTNVRNPSNNISQQGAPMPGSTPGSHSTATGPFLEYEDPMGGNQDTISSSDAPQANDTRANAGSPSNDVESASGSSDGDPEANVSNPSDNISQQDAPQHGTPKPRIKQGSRRTAEGSLTPYRDLLGGFLLNSVSGSSDGDPQANGCNPSNDVESTGADGAQQANNTRTNRAQKSSGSKRGQDSIMSEREREVLYLMALLR